MATPKVLLTGFNKVAQQMVDLGKIHAPLTKLTIGFWASYSVYVHEDLTKNHPNGQAKFLEYAIQNTMIVDDIKDRLDKGWALQDAMKEVGNNVLGYAKALCPTDTNFLVNSGFIRVDS